MITQGSARIQHAVRKRREPTGEQRAQRRAIRPTPGGPQTGPRDRRTAQEIPADQRKRRQPRYFSSCLAITTR
jgi:hypothetical protein